MPTSAVFAVANRNRTVGGLLSNAVTRAHGAAGLPAGSEFRIKLHGSAGQSFGAWLAPGIDVTLVGDANDYVGKGLSGGVLSLRPPEDARFASEENVIAGNTILYGATAGRAFFRGLVGERFAVRNSGATAVVEGVGDHGCEYMTGGTIVVLGRTGRNFAAGMSGGIAYVLDGDGTFAERCNGKFVGIGPLEADNLRPRPRAGTRMAHGLAARNRLLDDWQRSALRFVKVLPHDYRAAPSSATTTSPCRPAVTASSPANRKRKQPDGEDRRLQEVRARRSARARPGERIGNHREFVRALPLLELRDQGARCMECGVPFCHHGCPLGNLIPDWNDLVYRDRFREAIDQLHRTNNFPVTGRLCPAPCEAACVLEIEEGNAVTIKQIELAIVTRAWDEGWIVPELPTVRTGRSVAVVGCGPCRARVRAAAESRGPCGHRRRTRRGRRRIAPLRRTQISRSRAVVEQRVAPARG